MRCVRMQSPRHDVGTADKATDGLRVPPEQRQSSVNVEYACSVQFMFGFPISVYVIFDGRALRWILYCVHSTDFRINVKGYVQYAASYG
ncbi:hypothetical protein BDW02DRAFT_320955 [Decorospora gaudefroyi]|uniref:Uncharacterized protein n=1 Tax=Decorospora gaudefroyi TaxID=184978 RepID=A0A6A5KGD5_9PLEO|nr:hypothetical protein BDW02DRAFT_320955 [Decorospora gaudefroyi]